MATKITQSELKSRIADRLGVPKSAVDKVLVALAEEVHGGISKGQDVVIPGIAKVTVKRKPATKARKGENPFTHEPMTFKAKPARNVVKIRPLKATKDAV
jgi:nucleoid DNA-binding protein